MTSLFSTNPIPVQHTVEAVLDAYFNTINDEDFAATAGLFVEQGVLYPPFGRPVVGQEAIATYLAREAKGMRLCPNLDPLQPTLDQSQGMQIVLVSGQVQTSLFTVNVGWTFTLTANLEIQSIQVKLLASLEELLQLKSSGQ